MAESAWDLLTLRTIIFAPTHRIPPLIDLV